MNAGRSDGQEPNVQKSVLNKPGLKKSELRKTDAFKAEGQRSMWIALFLLPTMLVFLMFILWPIIASIYYSFFQWNGIGEWPSYYVGLRNYQDLIGDSHFWNAFKNTVVFVVLNNLIKLPLTLIIAYMLNNPRLRFSNLYRTGLFLPMVSSTAIIGIVMTFILNPWNGPLNKMLLDIGVLGRPVDWLGNINLAMLVVILVEVWHYSGQYIIYWLAGLQTIPKELYEAAEVDGANSVQTFLFVTIPALKPVIIIVTLLGIVMSLRVFDIVMAMTGGGPAFSTDVIGTFIYRNAFGTASPRIGYSSAVAVLFGGLIMVLGTLQGKIVGRGNHG
ncbi:MAG TPA: sugar ABC transporter permease [Clostridia bacterium]|nr:sugar ABC transporter permease [Clostridia bacterium]